MQGDAISESLKIERSENLLAQSHWAFGYIVGARFYRSFYGDGSAAERFGRCITWTI